MKQFIFILIVLFNLIGCSAEFQSTSWEYGIIPFYFQEGFSEEQKDKIRESMAVWEEKGLNRIKFIQHNNINDIPENILWIKVTTEISCATVGDQSSKLEKNEMNLKTDSPENEIQHELGHVLGLRHEHQRPDRDDYILINTQSISVISQQDQYVKYSENEYTIYDYKEYPFDFDSIMMYLENIINKKTGKHSHLGSIEISEIDAKKIQDIYK